MAGRSFTSPGFLVFIAGSTLCGFAPGIAWLIAARALQAVGAAMLSANSVAIIVSIAGDKLRGRALGIQTAVQAVGLCAGPTVGGWIVDALDWRWVFWVNVPFGIVGTVIAWFIIPQTSAAKPGSRFDMLAALLLVPGLGALMFAINQVGSWGLTSPGVIGSAVAGAILLTALIVWERRSSDPLIPLLAVREMVIRMRKSGQPVGQHHSVRPVLSDAIHLRARFWRDRIFRWSPLDDNSVGSWFDGPHQRCVVRPDRNQGSLHRRHADRVLGSRSCCPFN